jgi:hypothetical protein
MVRHKLIAIRPDGHTKAEAGRSTHSARLERWLGTEQVEHISQTMKGWYGPPIAIANVPGRVFACGDGDFCGPLKGGHFMNLTDFYVARLKRIWNNAARRGALSGQLNTGFASFSDLIAEATTGKRRDFSFQKVGATGVVAVTNSLWGLGNLPAAGANASAAPGGDAPTDATTGAFPFTNPDTGDTQHFVGGFVAANFVNCLLLYDRIFQVNKTMASTGTESVTGVPTRYQSSVETNMDYAGGNFIFVEVGGTALAATAHNWTVCQYRNQAGTDAQTMPSLTGNSGAIVRRLDHPTSQWFAPLATGDVGAMDLAQMQCSASVATGVINFVIGHPIAFMPIPIVNVVCVIDGINTAFNLVRVFDDAALAFLEITKPATNATTYTGMFSTVAG